MPEMSAVNHKRNLVIVSGYYGFGNLGDEAILEEIIIELKRIYRHSPQSIVVLSHHPKQTEHLFGVKAINRYNLFALACLAHRAKLLISGGGGLFQDTKSINSVIFYGLHILIAFLAGSKIMIYAQGMGPLQTSLARFTAKAVFTLANVISVRDQASYDLLTSWRLKANLTADPVWCLQPSKLPALLEAKLAKLIAQSPGCPLIGLSLRFSKHLTNAHIIDLQAALLQALPANANLLLLPLQVQDEVLLNDFVHPWLKAGRQATLINNQEILYPSQWLSLFSKLDLLVSMRLHALIMSFHASVSAVGIAYDPKVVSLLAEFEQPILILTNESQKASWASIIKQAFLTRGEQSKKVKVKADASKQLACQNFNLLSKILSM